ncbi:MAG: helix-hairpin-helix domain-containing protein [Thermomicrobiales bacterium]
MDPSHGSERRVPILGVAALAMAGAAILAFLVAQIWDDRRQLEIVILDPQAASTIVVSVEGAVATPGAYDLRGEARVRDAIEVAGGPADDADLREVNLARRLRDEERVVVPRMSDPPPATVEPRIPIPPAASGGLIDLNTASAEELDALPGIGPSLADRIVAYRAENGPFRSIDQLDDVQGISARMVDEIRPFVSVGP